MPLVGPALRCDNHLTSRVLSVFRAVGVAQDIEFTNVLDSQKLAAGASGLHIVFGRAGELDSVEQKQVLLGAITRNGEVVSRRRVRYASPTGLLRSKVDDPGIQREKQVIAPSVQ